mgnify:CR=1 FL=1
MGWLTKMQVAMAAVSLVLFLMAGQIGAAMWTGLALYYIGFKSEDRHL